MTDQLDWLDDLEADKRQVLPQDDQLQMLANLADHYETMEDEVADAEASLEAAKERFRRLREETIPDRMQEFGVKKIVLSDGSTLAYSDFYAGKVLNDEGYDWLEANGYQDAVKTELKIETSRVDRAALDRVMSFLMTAGFQNMSAKEKQSIHHMTLGATIKELTKQGRELPKDLFETYIGTRATLKKGKTNE
jgi:hypothetical protein